MTNNIVRTTSLNVGDKAYADFTKYSRTDVREGTVIKKSPTGIVQVDFGTSAPYSFMTNGAQRGADWHNKAQLISKERYDRQRATMERQRREKTAQEAVKAAYDIPATEANKAAVIEALTKALAAVEAI